MPKRTGITLELVLAAYLEHGTFRLAARHLGVSISTIAYWLQKVDIDKSRKAKVGRPLKAKSYKPNESEDIDKLLEKLKEVYKPTPTMGGKP